MIRISTANDPAAITIIVDGQLLSEYANAIELCSQQAASQRKPVHLFLRDVSHIDESGRALLSRLAAKGVQLSASGVYCSYIVAEVTRHNAENGRTGA